MYSKYERNMIDKHRNYFGDGWSLVDCRRITWPFYKTKVCYSYTEDKALPLVEEYVLKAIDTGFIQRIESLGQFLGLEQDILDTVLSDMHIRNIVHLSPSLALTERGKQLLIDKSRSVSEESTEYVYIDGVSGEAQIEDIKNSTYRDGKVQPAIVFPRPETLESHYRKLFEFFREHIAKRKKKQNKEERKESTSLERIVAIEGSSKRLYAERLVLFYQSDAVSGEGNQVVLTNQDVDDNATRNLSSALQEGKSGFDFINERNQPKELGNSRENHKSSQSYQLMSIQDVEKLPEQAMLSMLDHPIILEATLKTATSLIVIKSPWIRDVVIDNRFKESLEAALDRGVRVVFSYGMSTRNDRRKNTKEDIELKSKNYLELLAKRFEAFTLKKEEGDHSKVLICDEKFMVTSSYNWLSFPGAKSTQVRYETGHFTRSKTLIEKEVLRL